MSENTNIQSGSCCGPRIPSLRILTFPDGIQTGIIGLDDAMEDLFRQGKRPDEATASEMINILQCQNYIAASSRKQYEELFLNEYRRFFEMKTKIEEKNPTPTRDSALNVKRKGLLSKLFQSR